MDDETPANLTATRVAALRAQAALHLDDDEQAEAIDLYGEAVALCREAGNSDLLAHTLRHLGDIHRRTGNLEQARVACEEALTLYRAGAHTRPGDLANAVRSWALLHERLEEPAEARRAWGEARDLYARLGISAGVSEAEDALGRMGASS